MPTLEARELEGLADALWTARIGVRGCEPPTALHPGITLEDAYRVSRLNHERRLREGRVVPVGRKIGLTSEAVQRQLGVAQPDFGYLTSDMRVEDGGTVPRGSLLQPKVEAEVAFVLKRPLRGPGVGPADVRAATDHVVACIEIIDSRVRDWKIKIQDTIADNASSAAFVLGRERVPLDKADLVRAPMTLSKGGPPLSQGTGAACMGDPVNAVVWLANALGEFGEELKAGDIVLSGAYGPVVPFAPGERCEVEIGGLGRVSCDYGA